MVTRQGEAEKGDETEKREVQEYISVPCNCVSAADALEAVIELSERGSTSAARCLEPAARTEDD